MTRSEQLIPFPIQGYKIEYRSPKLSSSGTSRYLTLPASWAKVAIIDLTEDPDAAIAEARARAGTFATKMEQEKPARASTSKRQSRGKKPSKKRR